MNPIGEGGGGCLGFFVYLFSGIQYKAGGGVRVGVRGRDLPTVYCQYSRSHSWERLLKQQTSVFRIYIYIGIYIYIVYILQSHCIHTHSSTGPVVHPSAYRHEGPRFYPQWGTSVKPGFTGKRCLAIKYDIYIETAAYM